tara:strand:- start:599 stop:838 length:240 start_codon:yes stop_codon:yes gene_type:complete
MKYYTKRAGLVFSQAEVKALMTAHEVLVKARALIERVEGDGGHVHGDATDAVVISGSRLGELLENIENSYSKKELDVGT